MTSKVIRVVNIIIQKLFLKFLGNYKLLEFQYNIIKHKNANKCLQSFRFLLVIKGSFQFGMPSNSPFPHNPMAQIGGHMMAGPQPMDRMEQG